MWGNWNVLLKVLFFYLIKTPVQQKCNLTITALLKHSPTDGNILQKTKFWDTLGYNLTHGLKRRWQQRQGWWEKNFKMHPW